MFDLGGDMAGSVMLNGRAVDPDDPEMRKLFMSLASDPDALRGQFAGYNSGAIKEKPSQQALAALKNPSLQIEEGKFFDEMLKYMIENALRNRSQGSGPSLYDDPEVQGAVPAGGSRYK
jgi:hypothetical protein